MDTEPLDYASPHSHPPRLSLSLTPQERRFRRRMLTGLVVALILGLIPYPTQVCPSLKLQIVDENGKPVTDVVSAHWEGLTDTGNLQGYAPFDMAGKLSLQRQWVWANPISRCWSRFSRNLPAHFGGGGWADTCATVYFNIPRDYVLDAPAMGLTPDSAWAGTTIKGWRDPRTGDGFSVNAVFQGTGDVLYLIIRNPGQWGSADYKVTFIMRRKTASAAPTTRPTGTGG